VFMPFAVPLMVEGLTVSASAITRPLLAVVLGFPIMVVFAWLAKKWFKESS